MNNKEESLKSPEPLLFRHTCGDEGMNEQDITVKMKCFFCGIEDAIVIEEHHVYPRWAIANNQMEDVKVYLCRNCHKKVHYLLGYYKAYVEEKITEPSNSPEKTEEPITGLQPPIPDFVTVNALLQRVVSIITEAEKQVPMVEDGWLKDELNKRWNISPTNADNLLKSLAKDGKIYEPRAGWWKTVT